MSHDGGRAVQAGCWADCSWTGQRSGYFPLALAKSSLVAVKRAIGESATEVRPKPPR